MYKTVSFNIFEENLEEVVYRNDLAIHADDKIPAEKTVEKVTQQSREIIIKPLNDQSPDRENQSPQTLKNWR